MVKVKICGITNLEDARAAVEAGYDALGFVFYKKSPRYIPPLRAKEIISQVPKEIIKVGVFVNAPEKTIKNIAKTCHLDILQFHGDETPRFCQKFKSYRIIKAFRIKDKIGAQEILRYKTFAYLFDAFSRRKWGGTGETFDWSLLCQVKHPIFLSGGLNTSNVQQAIKTVHPDWIDVSSSVERMPGQKDYKKIKKFIEAAKRKK